MAENQDVAGTQGSSLPKEAYNRYVNDTITLHNSVARENPEQSVFDAFAANEDSFEKIRIGDKSVNEMINGLLWGQNA